MTAEFRLPAVAAALGWTAFLSVLGTLALVLLWVPPEQTMGEVQRIFYVHVAAAWNALLAFAVVFGCSVAYLRSGARRWDHLAGAAAEIGVVFTTMVLITGPIWARPIWNVWWTWDPRLTTTLVLWFMYVGYLFIRASALGSEGEARLAAAFGIIGFVDVPLVFFSTRWWRSIHPAVVTWGRLNMEPAMAATMAAAIGSFTLVFLYLLLQRSHLEGMRAQAEELRNRLIGGWGE